MRPDAQLYGLLGVTSPGHPQGPVPQAHDEPEPEPASSPTASSTTARRPPTSWPARRRSRPYTTPTRSTVNPAVTVRSVGSAGGEAAAFAFDLARSVVYTRQGNPAWARQERDGVAPIRPDDLFFEAAGEPEPDWIDLNKVAIPQADEQQRLLVNLITRMARDVMPIPRFWYFPRDEEAVIVMTGDDHASGGTAGRFDSQAARARPAAPWRTGSASAAPPTSTPTRRSPTRRQRLRRAGLRSRPARRHELRQLDAGAARELLLDAAGRLAGEVREPAFAGLEPHALHLGGATGRRIRRRSWPTASASTRTTTTGPRTGSRTGPACSPARACRCASPTSTAR